MCTYIFLKTLISEVACYTSPFEKKKKNSKRCNSKLWHKNYHWVQTNCCNGHHYVWDWVQTYNAVYSYGLCSPPFFFSHKQHLSSLFFLFTTTVLVHRSLLSCYILCFNVSLYLWVSVSIPTLVSLAWHILGCVSSLLMLLLQSLFFSIHFHLSLPFHLPWILCMEQEDSFPISTSLQAFCIQQLMLFLHFIYKRSKQENADSSRLTLLVIKSWFWPTAWLEQQQDAKSFKTPFRHFQANIFFYAWYWAATQCSTCLW